MTVTEVQVEQRLLHIEYHGYHRIHLITQINIRKPQFDQQSYFDVIIYYLMCCLLQEVSLVKITFCFYIVHFQSEKPGPHVFEYIQQEVFVQFAVTNAEATHSWLPFMIDKQFHQLNQAGTGTLELDSVNEYILDFFF